MLAVGLLLLGWLLNTPPGLLGKADAVGYAVCHRIELRSFALGERQLSLCARCTGMYLGAMLALAMQLGIGKKRAANPPLPVWLALGIFVLLFGIDGVNSYLHLFPGFVGIYEPQNWLRLFTGTGMGVSIGVALYPAFNQTVWADWEPQAAISGLPALGLLVLLAAVMDGLVLLENPLILYPLALISAAGVLVLLSMVYVMVLLIVLKQENRFLRFHQLWLPFTGGFGLALLQIVVLDVGRYILTGTWDGFHLG